MGNCDFGKRKLNKTFLISYKLELTNEQDNCEKRIFSLTMRGGNNARENKRKQSKMKVKKKSDF